jgi:hypothetical protein
MIFVNILFFNLIYFDSDKQNCMRFIYNKGIYIYIKCSEKKDLIKKPNYLMVKLIKKKKFRWKIGINLIADMKKKKRLKVYVKLMVLTRG